MTVDLDRLDSEWPPPESATHATPKRKSLLEALAEASAALDALLKEYESGGLVKGWTSRNVDAAMAAAREGAKNLRDAVGGPGHDPEGEYLREVEQVCSVLDAAKTYRRTRVDWPLLAVLQVMEDEE